MEQQKTFVDLSLTLRQFSDLDVRAHVLADLYGKVRTALDLCKGDLHFPFYVRFIVIVLLFLMDTWNQLALLCTKRMSINQWSIYLSIYLSMGIDSLRFSLLNHSCVPNCVATNQQARMQVRAVRPIKAGEEVIRNDLLQLFLLCITLTRLPLAISASFNLLKVAETHSRNSIVFCALVLVVVALK